MVYRVKSHNTAEMLPSDILMLLLMVVCTVMGSIATAIRPSVRSFVRSFVEMLQWILSQCACVFDCFPWTLRVAVSFSE